jgi:hypothetical protein
MYLYTGNAIHLMSQSVLIIVHTYFCAGMIWISAAVRKPSVPYDQGTA